MSFWSLPSRHIHIFLTRGFLTYHWIVHHLGPFRFFSLLRFYSRQKPQCHQHRTIKQIHRLRLGLLQWGDQAPEAWYVSMIARACIWNYFSRWCGSSFIYFLRVSYAAVLSPAFFLYTYHTNSRRVEQRTCRHDGNSWPYGPRETWWIPPHRRWYVKLRKGIGWRKIKIRLTS